MIFSASVGGRGQKRDYISIPVITLLPPVNSVTLNVLSHVLHARTPCNVIFRILAASIQSITLNSNRS